MSNNSQHAKEHDNLENSHRAKEHRNLENSQHAKEHRTFITDSDSDFENTVKNANIIKHYKNKRPNVVTNLAPEHDNINYQHKKTVPGNSNYAQMARSGKKVCIMSSSICSRIKMGKFSKGLTNGYAYRQAHNGCVPKQLLHYSTYNLENDRPDVVIIHVGGNALGER